MAKLKIHALSVCVILLSSCPLLFATDIDPIVTDRPDFTESTEVVPHAMTQLEAGVTASRMGDEHSYSTGELLIRRSLNEKTELRIEIPNHLLSRHKSLSISNFEDGSIGFKTVLHAGKIGSHHPKVSLIGSTSLPSGSRGARIGGVQPQIKLLAGVDLSKRISLTSNLNAASLKDERGRYGEFAASLSLGAEVTEQVGSFLEVFAFSPGGGRDSTRYVNGGFTFQLNPNQQIDIRAGHGINNDVDGPEYFYGIGFATRF